ELAEYINTPSWNRPVFYNNDDDDDEDCTIGITPDYPITDYLSMGDEHLDTIPATKSDKFIKSSVENNVPIPKNESFRFDIPSFSRPPTKPPDENESFRFDIPSFSRPPAKPPDGNTRILNIKMMGDNSKQKLSAKCPMMIHGKNIPIL
nr:hypothetical protein [Tanacetum cinerariifolium]